MKNPWQIKASRSIYDNAWINLTEYDVINPGGGTGIYGKVHFKNTAIAVVVLDEDKNTYLVGQHRFVLNIRTWEIPEGGCPEGEDYLSAAKRELVEEAGLTADTWIELLRTHLSNSVSDEMAIVYLAQRIKVGDASPEETEDIQIKKLPFTEAVQMVAEGIITDALSIMAIQRLQLLVLQNKI